MFNSRTKTLRMIRIAVIGIFAVIIIAYAIWRSLNYARGPEIDISEPTDGTSATSSTLMIRGRVLRVNSLSLNGNPISVDQQGDFNETIVVFPGINILSLTGQDRFGRSARKELEIVGLEDLPTAHSLIPPTTSTSTGNSS